MPRSPSSAWRRLPRSTPAARRVLLDVPGQLLAGDVAVFCPALLAILLDRRGGQRAVQLGFELLRESGGQVGGFLLRRRRFDRGDNTLGQLSVGHRMTPWRRAQGPQRAALAVCRRGSARIRNRRYLPVVR